MMCVPFWTAQLVPAWPGWSRYAAGLVMTTVWWRLAFPTLRSWAPRVSAALLAHGRCGSCGYPLPGTVPGKGDGLAPPPPAPAVLVTCPECGAAWSTVRVCPGPPASATL